MVDRACARYVDLLRVAHRHTFAVAGSLVHLRVDARALAVEEVPECRGDAERVCPSTINITTMSQSLDRSMEEREGTEK